MRLQILIPQYKEDDTVIQPLLDSVAIQQSVDFNDIGVIITNDGSDVFLSDKLLNKYPFHIDYYKEQHNGVSAARNYCLDKATAEYVMFCDADDMFCNNCGLWYILSLIEEGFDTLSSAFAEETHDPETNKIMYITREFDGTFVHGKVHRRQYLIDNNIRFNDNLTIHEDSYFNILCQSLTKEVKYCQTVFYLWKWRNESVCRHDPKYMLKTYKNMLDSNDALIDEFISRDMQDKVTFYTALMTFDAYYTMNKPEWIDQENQEYRHDTELRFASWFEKHKSIWDKMPIRDKMAISNQIRGRSVMEGMEMETITIEQWLKHIKEIT